MITFLPGDGNEYEVEVSYIAYNGPRAPDGTCAFCKGDPCAEQSDITTSIGLYYSRNQHAETCPMCRGAPS